MTPLERKAVKEGKHQRIRKLLTNMRAIRSEPVVKDQQWLTSMGEGIGLPGYRSSQDGPFPASRKAS